MIKLFCTVSQIILDFLTFNMNYLYVVTLKRLLVKEGINNFLSLPSVCWYVGICFLQSATKYICLIYFSMYLKIQKYNGYSNQVLTASYVSSWCVVCLLNLVSIHFCRSFAAAIPTTLTKTIAIIIKIKHYLSKSSVRANVKIYVNTLGLR